VQRILLFPNFKAGRGRSAGGDVALVV
jgi:hypothetical protein